MREECQVWPRAASLLYLVNTPLRNRPYLSSLSLLLLVSLLDHDEEEVFVGGDEDLLLLSAHSEERHIIHWVNVAHH